MNQSRRWLLYFRENQAEPTDIPWHAATPRADALGRAILKSIQQFELGENSAGIRFLDLARAYARRTSDATFPETIALFIAEEQRHSALLRRYLRIANRPTLKRHWVHSAFRWLRGLGGLEAKVTVLVTAEILALPYYRAVQSIANCPTLEAICRRVLREEAQHLLFQANTLRMLQSHRSRVEILAAHIAQQFLLAGTVGIVWWGHRRIFAAAETTLLDVWRISDAALAQVQRAASTSLPQQLEPHVEAEVYLHRLAKASAETTPIHPA